MGAVVRGVFFFVLVAELGGKVCTIDSKELFSDKKIVGWIHYSDLGL
jgi:hypothetical protein